MENCENSKLNFPKTKFFEACRGVFEGGGCRAAAHVGAYEAALKCGVNFSEISGTSAGSIVAALVGAGASTEFLKTNLSELDFNLFLKKPDKQKIESPFWLRFLGHFLGSLPIRWMLRPYEIGNIILYGGLYSSVQIELWIDGLLAKLLPHGSRPILFKDLYIPVRIIATDLVAGKAKIWGTKETPNEKVGFAVRCSCSIPGFFQPVSSGMSRYFDGGVLSNLPSFVYSNENSVNGSSLGGRILAFRLQEDFKAQEKWSFKALLERLMSTVVSGATDLQVNIQGGVHLVSIPTGTTRATDFQKISKSDIKRLQQSGKQATIKFIREESFRIQDTTSIESSCWDRSEMYDMLVKAAQEPALEIFIVEQDTEWFWKLFPSVYKWCSNGTQVKVLITPISSKDAKALREQQRRNLLVSLGVELKEERELPIQGYFIRRSDDNRDAAIIIHKRRSEDAPKATSYIGSRHREMIAVACDNLTEFFAGRRNLNIELKSYSPDDLIKLLKKNVWQYSKSNVKIKAEDVPVEKIKLITKYVRSYKYRQISYLADAYHASRIPFFSTAAVFVNSNKISIVTPPVIEEHGNHLVSIEGNTRVLYCRRNNITRLNCFVVRGVSDQLPGRAIDPRRVVLSTRRMEPRERMEGFNYELFRSIEGAVRPLKEMKGS